MTNHSKQSPTEPTRTGASGGTSAHVETKPAAAEESRVTKVETLATDAKDIAEQALATAQAKTPTSSTPGTPTERKEQKFVPSVNRWVQYGFPKEAPPDIEPVVEDGAPAAEKPEAKEKKDYGYYVDAALITAVNDDGTVELTVFPAKGTQRDVNKSLAHAYFVENAKFSKQPCAGCYFQAPYVPQG